MPKPKPAATHFVVERFNWRRGGRDGTFFRLPGFSRIQSFNTQEEAEAFRFAEELKARGVVNPFLGTLAPPTDQTDLPEYALADWYTDHGFDPPKADKKGKRDWAKWWAKESKKWKPDRAAVAWEPLHRVQFYRISERPKVPVGYALVRVNWGYNDECYFAHDEGGEVTTVFRSREKAEGECGNRNRTYARQWGGNDDEGQFELGERVLPGQSPFAPLTALKPGESDDEILYTAEEVPFWEVIEIELEGIK
jgi:hypothetical protein